MINLYDIEIPSSGETFDTLLSTDRAIIQRIVSSDILTQTTYIQDEDEWVILIEGSATLEIDTKIVTLCKGEHIHIPAKTPHKVLSTTKGTIWLAVHII